ncbi:MAG: TIM barrel protein [Planctomycetaceae bacterium]|jgi:hydroxypyruvate isomerase|nr:TIM barrel protein [Planctomycetaceae bacterium]
MSVNLISRRGVLTSAAMGLAAAVLPNCVPLTSIALAEDDVEGYSCKGNIRQSVSKWCFGKVPLVELCQKCKKMGMVGIDLLGPNDWDTMLEQEMIVTMGSVPGADIHLGFNKIKNHDRLVEAYEKFIPLAAEKKVPNLICLSGNREGTSDDEGIENCVKGLSRIVPLAEKHKVTLCMELLNGNMHKDYHADRTWFGAAVARKLDSERFKLLYDIFHMQIMEGNVIDTIREYKDVIGHYHTAGVPGRSDLDDTQELQYVPIMKAIVATGFKGFVGHEFKPKNGLKSLRDAVVLCDV